MSKKIYIIFIIILILFPVYSAETNVSTNEWTIIVGDAVFIVNLGSINYYYPEHIIDIKFDEIFKNSFENN
jgi:hypothetical protein